MSDEKPGIGRPSKYMAYLAKLDDEELYTPTALATLFQQWGGLNRKRTQVDLAQRAIYHQMKPDGHVIAPIGRLPAYSGKQWKSTLDTVRLNESEGDGPSVEPVEPLQTEATKVKASRPLSLKYDHFIRALHPFKRYQPRQIVEHGLKKDLFSRSDTKRQADEQAKVERSMWSFARRLPESPDNPGKEKVGRAEKAWYGWRWQLALPENLFSERERRKLNRRIRLRRWASKSNLAIAVCLTVCIGAVFAVGPSKLMHGGRILKDQGPKAAYQFFMKESDASDQVLFGRAWAAFRNQRLAEALFLAEKLLHTTNDNQTKADAHYLLGFIQGQLGEFQEGYSELKIASEAYKILGQNRDVQQCYHGMARFSLLSYRNDEAKDDDLLIQAEIDLEMSKNFEEKPSAIYFQLLSRILFEREDYWGAYEASKEAVKYSGTDKSRLAVSLSDQGFFLIILGDFDAGMELTRQAENLIFEISDNSLYAFNLINEYLFLKCTGEQSKVVEGILTDWSAKDIELNRYLSLVKKLQCPEENRIGSTYPDPPTTMGGGGKIKP